MSIAMFRNVGVLASGAAVAQVIGLLTLPVLSRVYGPEAFGDYQLYLAIAAVFAVVPTLRLDLAVYRASDPADMKALLDLNLLLTLAFAFVVLAAAAVWDLFGPALSLPPSPISPYLLVPTLIVASLYQYLAQIVVREKAFALATWGKIAQAIAFAIVAIGIGYVFSQRYGIVVADLIGKTVAVGAALLVLRRSAFKFYNGVGRAQLLKTLGRFRQFPLISWPGSLVGVFAAFLTPTLIYAAFTAHDAGQYAMAERTLMLPVSFVVAAVSQAYSADLAELIRAGSRKARRSFRRLVLILAALGALPTLVVAIFAPALFALVFGEQWRTAGEIARILIVPAYVGMIYGAVNMVLVVLGTQKLQVGWEILRLVLVAGLWWGGLRYGLDLFQMVTLYAVVWACLSIAYVVLCDIMLAHHDRGSLRHFEDDEIAVVDALAADIGPGQVIGRPVDGER